MSKVSSHDFSTQTHTFASGAVRVARENRTYRIFLIPATYGTFTIHKVKRESLHKEELTKSNAAKHG